MTIGTGTRLKLNLNGFGDRKVTRIPPPRKSRVVLTPKNKLGTPYTSPNHSRISEKSFPYFYSDD